MNPRQQTLSSVALILAFTAPCAVLLGQETVLTGSHTTTIQVSAKKYEFNPAIITVKQGDHVKLVIRATDRDHGFGLKAYGINQPLKKGVPATVEFTADRVGKFPFECTDFCGLGHGRTKGKLVVIPASP